MKLTSILVLSVILATTCDSIAQNQSPNSQESTIKFVKHEAVKKVDVMIDG